MGQMLSDIFSLNCENIMKNLTDVKEITIGGDNITTIRYADDTLLTAENEIDLQNLVFMLLLLTVKS